jgi:RimJ/RimL family protein N-acetyltransferase/8-oxo-dGTP pyrophosphatase MutT (NUDIX family)
MISCTGPTITTPRLTLRPWREDDLPALAAINADPYVMRFMPKTLNLEETQAALKTLREQLHQHGFGVWAVEAAAVPQIVGGVGLSHPHYAAHFTPCIEISWRIAHQQQGRGYATEAARAALAFGFTQLKLDEIVAVTVPANEPSWLLMERLGMKRNLEDDFNHPLLPPDHPLSRRVLYRLKQTDWEARAITPSTTNTPQFGRKLDGRSYLIRPGSYAIIRNTRGQICIVEGIRGNGLPGGGAEPGETPIQTLNREMREECGQDIIIEREIGFAVEFVHSAFEGNFEKRCTFYQCRFANDRKPLVVEPGISLLWLSPADALAVLTPESHRWAVARSAGWH